MEIRFLKFLKEFRGGLIITLLVVGPYYKEGPR